MAKRPVGVRTLLGAFDAGRLDVEALRRFDRPVYFALGGRSNQGTAGIAERLAGIFPDFTLETFSERHHFDPPHRVEAERLANSLLELWERATTSRKDEPMKLMTLTQVTVDGVMQGNGGATDEDRRNGFERGGWAMGAGDDETLAFIGQTYAARRRVPVRPADLRALRRLLGREERARAAAEDPGLHLIAAALNTKPKYLASTTLTDPRWADTTPLSGDLAAPSAS